MTLIPRWAKVVRLPPVIPECREPNTTRSPAHYVLLPRAHRDIEGQRWSAGREEEREEQNSDHCATLDIRFEASNRVKVFLLIVTWLCLSCGKAPDLGVLKTSIPILYLGGAVR